MALSDILKARNDQTLTTGSYEQAQSLLKWTYVWMFFGLIITSVVAFVSSTNAGLMEARLTPGVAIIAFIAQIGIALAMGFLIQRISAGVAALLFMAYAGIMGFTLSIVFLAFNLGTITLAFASAATLFAVMSVFAFTTKTDLSRFGNILMVGLIALIIVSVINWFIGSSLLAFLVSVVGVVIFLGLTAYDTQNIQRMAMHPEIQANNELATKMGIFSAFQLYLNFIMLFIYLLQIFGFAGGND
jgi:FtsH-binding integral membrane protein